MTTVIRVNRQFIAYNARIGDPVLPTYIVRKPGRAPIYCYGFEIKGGLTGIDPRRRAPLKCGARAWLETEADVRCTGGMTFAKAVRLKDLVTDEAGRD